MPRFIGISIWSPNFDDSVMTCQKPKMVIYAWFVITKLRETSVCWVSLLVMTLGLISIEFIVWRRSIDELNSDILQRNFGFDFGKFRNVFRENSPFESEWLTYGFVMRCFTLKVMCACVCVCACRCFITLKRQKKSIPCASLHNTVSKNYNNINWYKDNDSICHF